VVAQVDSISAETTNLLRRRVGNLRVVRETVDLEPIVPPDGSRHATFYAVRVKRLFDVVVALFALVLIAPILLLVSAAVALAMGRPILFRQKRLGLNGEVIEVLKFRTMKPDRRQAEADGYGEVDRRKTHKTAAHPLLTPIGRFLRVWSLDELPQLLNVVRGDMSIVGPRPELVSLAATYESWQNARVLVRPGLTGLWQITARGDGPMHDRTDLDVDYLCEVSLVRDLTIIVRTPAAMFGDHKGF
jgi:lipopolysaccharide/colanic/teichoic acid biosynthesis glycosyltransferase